jgi:hypothetical protein
MTTFFCVFLRTIEGGQNPGSTFWPRAGPFSIPLAKGGVTDERSLAVRVSVLGWGLRVEQRGAVCQGRRAVIAKQELEVPDEVKLAQAEVELTPAFMTKSGGPYKCPP